MQRHKVILDIDNAFTIPAQDTDDAMALALALTSPEIELIGITTCAGNCRTWQSTENSLRMLELAGRGDIPVAAGREEPFILNSEPSFQYLEAKTASRERVYWDDMPQQIEPSLQPSPLPAHEFIIEMMCPTSCQKRSPGSTNRTRNHRATWLLASTRNDLSDS